MVEGIAPWGWTLTASGLIHFVPQDMIEDRGYLRGNATCGLRLTAIPPDAGDPWLTKRRCQRCERFLERRATP
jgi:hypothetical protein